jgi:hypothetical protein
MNRFSEEDIRRYSRQILLREVGGRGQQRILDACATLVCSNGVGETAAQYLGRAGVKRVRLFATDLSSTQRLRELVDSEGVSVGRRLILLPLLEAPGSLRASLETAQPLRFTVGHWDAGGPEEIYWTIADERGVTVGQGAAEMHAESDARAAEDRLRTAPAGSEAAASLLAGSALALFMLQRLLGMEPPAPVRFFPLSEAAAG